MTKAELVNRVSKRTDLNKRDAEVMVQTVEIETKPEA